MHGTESTRDVHSRVGDIAPDMPQSRCITRVSRQRTDVRHAGIEIGRSHSMADGLPLLADPALAARWTEAFQAAFARHRKLCRRRREVLFDADAAENAAEFFATAIELFFEYPRDLRAEYTAVHEVLAAWLQLDPAAWSSD